MLQYLTTLSDKYSMAEQAQMMIEAGCTWIEITRADHDMDMRQTIDSISDLCRENGAFLMIDSDVEIANDTRIHGVHLHRSDMSPAQAREVLGPHAVIGVDADTAEEIIALKGLDVDYVVVDGFGTTRALEAYRTLVQMVHVAGCSLPIVARGAIGIDDIAPLMGTGVNGLAMSTALIDAPDPVAACTQALDILSNITSR